MAEGRDHPDPVVESRGLAGVQLPPIKYAHRLHDVVASGTLSFLQLEFVAYANFRHEHKRLIEDNGSRAAILNADGTGHVTARVTATACRLRRLARCRAARRRAQTRAQASGRAQGSRRLTPRARPQRGQGAPDGCADP